MTDDERERLIGDMIFEVLSKGKGNLNKGMRAALKVAEAVIRADERAKQPQLEAKG